MWWVSHVRTRFVTLYWFTGYQRKIFSDILWELSQVFMSACHKHLYGRYISILLLLCSICYTILSSWLPWQSQQSTADWPHSFSHRSSVLGQVWHCCCVKVGHNWKTCSGVWILVPHGHSSVHSWRRQASFMLMCGHADILHWGRTGYSMLPVFVVFVVVVNALAGKVHRKCSLLLCLQALLGHCITWLTCWIPSTPGSQPLNFDAWSLSCISFTPASPTQHSFKLKNVVILLH